MEQNNEIKNSSAEETKYVNTNLQRWEQERSKWLKGHDKESDMVGGAVQIPVDDIIDIIISNRWNTSEEKSDSTFAKAVPLPQMVDILVDLWEAEGLDI